MENTPIKRSDITEVDNGTLGFVVSPNEEVHLFLKDKSYLGSFKFIEAGGGKFRVFCKMDKEIVILRDKALKS